MTLKSQLEACLRQALSKVAKCHVLLRDDSSFRPWTTINIDSDGLPDDHYPEQERIQRVGEYDQMKHYLVAYFRNSLGYSFSNAWKPWNLLHKQFLKDNLVCDSLLCNNEDYFNSIHQSIWRRVYANNYSYFCSSDTKIAAYVKEQMKISQPIHVFKEIMKRENGETFNQFGILETLASPYYYVLPHQYEIYDDEIKRFILHCLTFKVIDESYAGKEMLCFNSKLSIARKYTARLD